MNILLYARPAARMLAPCNNVTGKKLELATRAPHPKEPLLSFSISTLIMQKHYTAILAPF